jgi:hypothetical protein
MKNHERRDATIKAFFSSAAAGSVQSQIGGGSGWAIDETADLTETGIAKKPSGNV